MCGLLSSSRVTRLLRYYETIRLPVPDFASLPLQLSGILPLQKESTGPPGCPCNPNVRHAMVSDPGEANIVLPLTPMLVLTSTSIKVLSFSSRHLRGSIPSTFRLTAYLLAVLRLKHIVANMPPQTRYPVVGQQGRPWRRIHYPMLRAYAAIAGQEVAVAEHNGRDFDIRPALDRLVR